MVFMPIFLQCLVGRGGWCPSFKGHLPCSLEIMCQVLVGGGLTSDIFDIHAQGSISLIETGVLHPHLVCQKGNSKRNSSFSMHQCSGLDYLDASSKLAAKSNRALSAVFARQASLLFFSLNVLCLLLMAKALPVKRWGAMGGTMNDIGDDHSKRLLRTSAEGHC